MRNENVIKGLLSVFKTNTKSLDLSKAIEILDNYDIDFDFKSVYDNYLISYISIRDISERKVSVSDLKKLSNLGVGFNRFIDDKCVFFYQS